jgi:hypothetical protein
MSRLTAICLLSFVALNNQAHAADDGGCTIKYIENGKISGTQNEADFNTMKAVARVYGALFRRARHPQDRGRYTF